ncbi:MAG: hypothetical protein Q4E99_05190 [Bacillota bacterium]|nr:hypothetical protein [Bacillota bacterium]
MNLDSIKDNLGKFLDEKKLKLFEITYQKKDQTLSVLLDEELDMDKIEKISNEISEYLDKFEEEFDDNYILDVSTVGAERPIRNEDELIKAMGEYIYVKTSESEYYGTLLDFTNGIIHMEVKEKTKIKNISIDYKKTKKVRYAVKF